MDYIKMSFLPLGGGGGGGCVREKSILCITTLSGRLRRRIRMFILCKGKLDFE
jgi:hypothetical protein